ncbi:MAG TPA: hypothetical protein V6C69_09045 [Trichormus sp.]|jgi:hypothetical protein
MTPTERLVECQKEIRAILAEYGAHRVRIFGVTDQKEYIEEPEVDVLVNFDYHQNGDPQVLVCFRDSFVPPGGSRKRWMDRGWILFRTMRKLLECPISVCTDTAVKNFYPATYAKTFSTNK